MLTLGAAGFSAAGFLAGAAAAGFFASLTGPDLPLGMSNSPLLTPEASAVLMCWLSWVSVVLPRLLLAWMYFLMA